MYVSWLEVSLQVLLGFVVVQKTEVPRDQVEDWLQSLDVYTLHKPIRHRYKTRRVLVNGIDNQWQADLVDIRN